MYNKLSKWKKDLKNIKDINVPIITPTRFNGKVAVYGKDIDLELFKLVKEKMFIEKSNVACNDTMLRELLLSLLQSHGKMNLLLGNGGSCVFQRSWALRFWKRYENQLQEVKNQIEAEITFHNYIAFHLFNGDSTIGSSAYTDRSAADKDDDDDDGDDDDDDDGAGVVSSMDAGASMIVLDNMSADMNMSAGNMNLPASVNMVGENWVSGNTFDGNMNDSIISTYTFGPNIAMYNSDEIQIQQIPSSTFQPPHNVISSHVHPSINSAQVTVAQANEFPLCSVDINNNNNVSFENTIGNNNDNDNPDNDDNHKSKKKNKKAWNHRPENWEEIGEYFEQHDQQSTVNRYPHILKHLPYSKIYQKLQLWRKDMMMQRTIKPLGRIPEYGKDIDDLLLNLVQEKLYRRERVSDGILRSMLVDLLKQKERQYLLRENGGENIYGSAWANRFWKRWMLPVRHSKCRKNNNEDDDDKDDNKDNDNNNKKMVDSFCAEGTTEGRTVEETIAINIDVSNLSYL